MPKIKRLTKAERKRRKRESAQNYYTKNREEVNERARLGMKRFRDRVHQEALTAQRMATIEAVRNTDIKAMARRGSRMYAEWRYSLSPPQGSGRSISVGSEAPTNEHSSYPPDLEGEEKSLSDDLMSEDRGSSFEKHSQQGYFFCNGRWRSMDDFGDEEAEGPGDNESRSLRVSTNSQSASVSHHYSTKTTSTIPISSPGLQHSQTRPIAATMHSAASNPDDLPPSSPPSSSDDSDRELPVAPYSDDEEA